MDFLAASSLVCSLGLAHAKALLRLYCCQLSSLQCLWRNLELICVHKRHLRHLLRAPQRNYLGMQAWNWRQPHCSHTQAARLSSYRPAHSSRTTSLLKPPLDGAFDLFSLQLRRPGIFLSFYRSCCRLSLSTTSTSTTLSATRPGTSLQSRSTPGLSSLLWPNCHSNCVIFPSMASVPYSWPNVRRVGASQQDLYSSLVAFCSMRFFWYP